MVKVEFIAPVIGQICGHRNRGDKMMLSEQHARTYIEMGVARLYREPSAPENKQAVVEGSPVKKSSGAPTIGPLTDSPSSSAPGQATPWSSWPVGQALRQGMSSAAEALVPPFRRRRRGGNSA